MGKFENFNELIQDAKARKIEALVIAWPEVLGDNYEELIENLGKLADANMLLAIEGRKKG